MNIEYKVVMNLVYVVLYMLFLKSVKQKCWLLKHTVIQPSLLWFFKMNLIHTTKQAINSSWNEQDFYN